MKNFKLKILLIIPVILLSFAFSLKVSAATLTLLTPNKIVHQQEQFKVVVNLLPNKNENINAFDISVLYSPNLTFIGSKDGSSVVSLWVEKPNEKSGTINFSGIIPGGFGGVIDPMNSDPLNNQKAGILTELIFVGNTEGESIINFDKQNVLANDGLGTKLEINSNDLTINIDKEIVPSTLDINDSNPPEHFLITLLQNSILFNGKYTIVFETKDKESGIDYFEIKEEGQEWQKGDSPYVTRNQPPVGTIYVKAVDYNGNSTTEKLTPEISTKQVTLYSKLLAIIIILIMVALLCTLIMFLKRKIFKAM